MVLVGWRSAGWRPGVCVRLRGGGGGAVSTHGAAEPRGALFSPEDQPSCPEGAQPRGSVVGEGLRARELKARQRRDTQCTRGGEVRGALLRSSLRRVAGSVRGRPYLACSRFRDQFSDFL